MTENLNCPHCGERAPVAESYQTIREKQLEEVLTRIIYASDGCVGHRDCNHSIEPWKDARKLLGLENDGTGS